MLEVLVKRLKPEAKIPTKAHKGDAGYDLYATEDIDILPGCIRQLWLGIAIAFPEDYVALMWDRSGMGKRGMHRLAGVIDSGYRGEWSVILVNLSDSCHQIKVGDKIAQVLFQRVEDVSWIDVDDESLSDSVRGVSGFGSSGR